MKKTFFILFAAIFLASAAIAQTQKISSVKEMNTLTDTFTGLLFNQKSAEAFDLLKPFWPQPAYQIDALRETTAQQIKLIEDNFGVLLGYEFASSETLGSFGHVETYVLKYEKNALRIYIIYYNSGSGWIVNSLLWDDRWDYLFTHDLKSK